jgi:hypothetical protein
MANHKAIDINLCLSDIPEDRIITGKNGKKYTNFRVKCYENPDNYGNTHQAYLPQTKEQKTQGVYPTKVGNGKFYDVNSQSAQNNNAPTSGKKISDDLPY